MTFSEFLQDMALVVFCLLVLAWMTSCAYIEKNVYNYIGSKGNIDNTYTTQSDTKTDAKDLADLEIIPPIP